MTQRSSIVAITTLGLSFHKARNNARGSVFETFDPPNAWEERQREH